MNKTFYETGRKTWRKGNLRISYSNPTITPFNKENVADMDDAMYFYYHVHVFHHKTIVFSFDAYDFPKVQDLPACIEYLMTYDMNKAYLLDDVKSGDFERQIRYHQTTLDDGFGFDTEYFYKLERYDYKVKQPHDEEPNEWTEYVLTIGSMKQHRDHGGMDREDYGETLTVKRITPEELIQLKDTANRFCEEAIRIYNKEQKEKQ